MFLTFNEFLYEKVGLFHYRGIADRTKHEVERISTTELFCCGITLKALNEHCDTCRRVEEEVKVWRGQHCMELLARDDRYSLH